jgi:hypothetical protein
MTTTTIEAAPVVHLSNGLRVVNFSSPHPFNFVDGSVLSACSKERSTALELGRKDSEVAWHNPLQAVKGEILAVTPGFLLTDKVEDELTTLEGWWDIDIILVPFPVIQLLREHAIARQEFPSLMARYSKAATVIMADRITKAAAIDKFGR